MNYETIRMNDLTVVLSIAAPTAPAGEAGAEAAPRLFGAAAPAPAAGQDRSDLQALAPKIASILETLHKAHLDGRLNFGDLQAMQQLELWYSQLKAEAPSQAKPKGKNR
jgi:hypothetical protein